jgi:segregation and condensation protein A
MATETPAPGTTDAATQGAAAAATPRIILPLFTGPLDLLLHLIRTNEISITDIPIVEVCRQYDGYLGLMQELDFEIAGEYLVMAATLMHIKSRMLLPAEPAAAGAQPEDPRAELVRQLLEYQRVKAAAEMLRDRDDLQADIFTRGHGGEDPLDPFRHETRLDVSLFDLLTAFKRLAESLGGSRPLLVHRDEISVAEKIAWILDRLESSDSLHFQALIVELPARGDRIAAFLAILELIRLRLVTARQNRPGGDIFLRRATSAEDDEEEKRGDDDPGH